MLRKKVGKETTRNGHEKNINVIEDSFHYAPKAWRALYRQRMPFETYNIRFQKLKQRLSKTDLEKYVPLKFKKNLELLHLICSPISFSLHNP